MLQPYGMKVGKALLERHNLIEKFLKVLNINEGLLEETEKIEHTINENILNGIKDLVNFFTDYPEVLVKFNEYRKSAKQNRQQ